jgi:hypothetical protein
MSRFSEHDPDDPELDYTPLRLSERAAKLGLSVSQGARSEPIRSSPISRPASLDPKAINELTRRTRDLDRRTALFSVAARVAAVAGVVAVVALLFVIMKPASRQSVAGSTPSDITGSTTTAPLQSSRGEVESKPVLADPLQSSRGEVESKPVLADPPQSSQGDVGSNPALAQFKAILASPPGQPDTHEQSQQLLQDFLQWRKKANTTETSQ